MSTACCVVCHRPAPKTSPRVPVRLTTTTKNPRYAHVSCLHRDPVAVADIPEAEGVIYNDLTYTMVVRYGRGRDSEALAAALLHTEQKYPWTRIPGGYAVKVPNIKNHGILKTLSRRLNGGTISCAVYHKGILVGTKTRSWYNADEAGRFLPSYDEEAQRWKRGAFLEEVDAITIPYKGYSNYPKRG